MQLSVKYKFAFLCIPKCGSTSIEKAIATYCETTLAGHPSLKHVNASKFKRYIRPLLHKAVPGDEIETFCIMREPVARIFSWYQYQSRKALRKPSHPSHQRYTGGVTFETFVEGYIAAKKPVYAKIGTQANFIRLVNGEIGVDRIFRLDHMDAVSDYLNEKIGRRVEIPHKNKSVKGSGKTFSDRTAGGLSSIFRLFGSSDAEFTAPSGSDAKPEKTSMEISAALLIQLKEYLAEDYKLFHSIPKH